MKRTISIFLVILMLLTAAPLSGVADMGRSGVLGVKAEAADSDNDHEVGDIINFGSYPQSRVTNSDLLKTLNETDSEWKSYGYYTGNGNYGSMVSSDYMKYRDVSVDGAKYRAVRFTKYRKYWTEIQADTSSSESNQSDNGYYINTTYWFKYEPISWRVLDPVDGLVVSEKILDSQAYNNYISSSFNDQYWGNSGHTYYASNYSKSSIRKWLNDDFFNTAFSDLQKNSIKQTYLENKSTESSDYDSPDSNDKIFLLSYWDTINTSYGFSSDGTVNNKARRAKGSPYAKAQGLEVDETGYSWWWLRSPSDETLSNCVESDGCSNNDEDVNETGYGVRPAMCIEFPDCFSEKKYIADIWLDLRGDDEPTVESKMIKDILGYKSVSETLADSLDSDKAFQKGVAAWESFSLTADVAGESKKLVFGRKELYESMILDLLQKMMEDEQYKNIIEDSVSQLGEWVSAVSPYYNTYTDILKLANVSTSNWQDILATDLSKTTLSVGDMMDLESVRSLSDKLQLKDIQLFMKQATTVSDFFKMLSSYSLAVNMTEEMSAFLNAIKANTKDDDLKGAITTIVKAVGRPDWAAFVANSRFFEQTSINVASLIISEFMFSNVVTAALKGGYEVGKLVSNLVFNTDDTISAYYACQAMREFIRADKKAIDSLASKYKAKNTEANAGAYVYAIKAYRHAHYADIDASVKFIKKSTEEGLANRYKSFAGCIVARFLNGEYKTYYDIADEDAESIKKSIDSNFEFLLNSWIYNDSYLQEDYPDQFKIYALADLSSDAYAPDITDISVQKDGKTKVSWYCSSTYTDSDGSVHSLYGAQYLDGVEATEEVEESVLNGTVTNQIGNNCVLFENKAFLSSFPKTYYVAAFLTQSGSRVYTQTAKRLLYNPCKTPSLSPKIIKEKFSLCITDYSRLIYDNIYYHILRKVDDGTLQPYKTIKRNNLSNETRFKDTDCAPGHTYTYQVYSEMRFTDGSMISSDKATDLLTVSNVGEFNIRPVKSITNNNGSSMKRASVGSNGGIRLVWDKEAGASGYELYRKSSYAPNYISLGSVNGNEYTDYSVTAGVSYDYFVMPYKNSDDSERSFDLNTFSKGEIDIPANPEICRHIFELKSEKAPTCSAEGKNVYLCSVCGATKTETVAKKDHTYKNILTKATPTKDGKIVPTCSVCGAKKTATVIAKASGIKLSKTSFTYNGKVRKPAPVVKDSEGKTIAAKYYTATWSNAKSKAIGSYTVKVSLKGNYSGSKTLTYKIVPQQTSGLKASKVAKTAITLSWTKVTGAKYYEVWGSADGGKTFKKVATPSANSLKVTKVAGKALAAGKKYQFRVRALDSTKKLIGAYSTVLKTGTLTAAPKIGKLTSTKAKTVTVTWGKVTGAKSYIVCKSTDGKTFKAVKTGITGTSYTLTKLTVGKKIYVKVIAVNAYGAKSAASAVKNVTVK